MNQWLSAILVFLVSLTSHAAYDWKSYECSLAIMKEPGAPSKPGSSNFPLYWLRNAKFQIGTHSNERNPEPVSFALTPTNAQSAEAQLARERLNDLEFDATENSDVQMIGYSLRGVEAISSYVNTVLQTNADINQSVRPQGNRIRRLLAKASHIFYLTPFVSGLALHLHPELQALGVSIEDWKGALIPLLSLSMASGIAGNMVKMSLNRTKTPKHSLFTFANEIERSLLPTVNQATPKSQLLFYSDTFYIPGAWAQVLIELKRRQNEAVSDERKMEVEAGIEALLDPKEFSEFFNEMRAENPKLGNLTFRVSADWIFQYDPDTNEPIMNAYYRYDLVDDNISGGGRKKKKKPTKPKEEVRPLFEGVWGGVEPEPVPIPVRTN
jgi:hypothetical protein